MTYELNFATRMFLVLLRIAIGWHLLYEGVEKLQTYREGIRPFSAETYLRRSTGPLRDTFRGILEDPDGLDRLDPLKLYPKWDEYVSNFAEHYNFTSEQRAAAEGKLGDIKESVDAYFKNPETQKKIDEYKETLADLEAAAENWTSRASFEQDRLMEKRLESERLRTQLLGRIRVNRQELRKQLNALLTEAQQNLDRYEPPMTTVDKVSLFTAWGLTIVGGLMLLGLFSRLSSLGGAAFVLLFYLAMPPWPGLPPNPLAESEYFIVSKNLIEVLAALVLATVPTGRWLGLDAVIHALVGRPIGRRLSR